jgi:hypothetical protein
MDLRTSILVGVLLFLGIAGYFVLPSFSVQETQAGSSDNVSGWAWSENIGWISFNCTNDSSCATVDYGTFIDPSSGFVSGYAWSDNIGWISFEHTDTGDPPSPYNYSNQNHIAELNQGNNQLRGWMRALSGIGGGGWDGWIKLYKHASDGGPSYGITYDPNTGELHGWAWGSDVVGWVSFNCAEGGPLGEDICSQSNYKVQASGSLFNQPPVAAASCTPVSCIGYTGDVLTLNNNSTDPDGQGDIVRSEWDIVSWGSNPDATCTAPALCNYTVQTQIMGPGNYQAELYVQDTIGASDTLSPLLSFTIRQDIVASFQCSLDQSLWQDCTTLNVSQGEVVYFQDQSTPSEAASAVTTWSWTFQNGNPATSTVQNPSSVFQSSGSKTVTLVATDNLGRQDTVQTTISVSLPFPDWEEISPF